MKYFTYVLKSERNGFLYVGSTKNIDDRLQKHNSGRVRSTKAYAPWVTVELHSFGTRGEAVKYEMFLKSGQQKEILHRKYD